MTGEVGDRLVLIFPIVKVSWAEDKVFNDDASCHMAATRFGKNCSAHAQARAASSVILTNFVRFPVIFVSLQVLKFGVRKQDQTADKSHLSFQCCRVCACP